MRKVSAKQQAQWEHEALERKFAKLQADYGKLKAKDVAPKPGETREIEGEKAYPIYSLGVEYACDGEHKPEYPNWHEGLPEGRIWGGSSVNDHMLKEVPSHPQMLKLLSERWERVVIKAAEPGNKHANPSPARLAYRFLRWETWCLTWFSHYTFDVGQSDAAVRASFDRFVERMERLNREESHPGEPYTDTDGKTWTPWVEPYCLMGAEDRYRWCGSTTGDEKGERTDPPCRCPHCKAQGVIRINH